LTGRRLVAVVAVLTLGACGSGSGPPPPQASQLRVLHTVRGGPSLTVFVDGGRGSTIAFGESSRLVTRYFDGAPGTWSVVISDARTTDTLLATGALMLGDGQAQTLVVLDSTPGGVTWRLLRDRD